MKKILALNLLFILSLMSMSCTIHKALDALTGQPTTKRIDPKTQVTATGDIKNSALKTGAEYGDHNMITMYDSFHLSKEVVMWVGLAGIISIFLLFGFAIWWFGKRSQRPEDKVTIDILKKDIEKLEKTQQLILTNQHDLLEKIREAKNGTH